MWTGGEEWRGEREEGMGVGEVKGGIWRTREKKVM